MYLEDNLWRRWASIVFSQTLHWPRIDFETPSRSLRETERCDLHHRYGGLDALGCVRTVRICWRLISNLFQTVSIFWDITRHWMPSSHQITITNLARDWQCFFLSVWTKISTCIVFTIENYWAQNDLCRMALSWRRQAPHSDAHWLQSAEAESSPRTLPKPSSSLNPVPKTLGFLQAPSLSRQYAVQSPAREDVDDMGIIQHMSELQLESKFFGASSSAGLITDALSVKDEYTRHP